MKRLRILKWSGLWIALVLAGCATTTGVRVEREGGISGTGNRIDCSVPEARKDPRCPKT